MLGQSRRLNPQGAVLFSVVLLIFLVNGIVVYQNTRTLHAIQNQLARSQDVMLRVEQTFSDLKDAESNARAYVAAGNDEFRRAYQQTSTSAANAIGALTASPADDNPRAERIQDFSNQVNSRLKLLKAIVQARAEHGFEAGRHLVDAGAKAAESAPVREAVDVFRADAAKISTASLEAVANNRKTMLTANVTAISIAILASAAAWYFVERELERNRQSEVAARAERQNLLMTLTSIGDAVLVTDAAKRVNLVNTVAREIIGRGDDLIGKSLDEIFPVFQRGTQTGAVSSVTKALRSGTIVGTVDELVLKRPDGTEVPIEDSAGPIRDDVGEITGVVLVFRDCTQRLEFQRVARDRERRFRRMFETPLIGIAVGNAAGYLEEANDAYLELIGYQRGVMEESSLSWGGVPIGQSPLNEQAQLEIAETGVCKPFERTYRNSAGQDIPVLVSAARLSDQQDRIVVYVMDLTQSRRAEAAYRESESKFQVLSECMPQKVWTARSDGQLEYLNQMLVEYAGRTNEELRGWGWLDLIHPDDIDSHRKAWQEAVASREMFETEVRLRKFTGEYRWHLTRALPVSAPDTQIVTWLGTNTDIHDQKLAEESLREEHRRKDQFLALLAHELRNPLAPLSNAVQVFSSLRHDPARSGDLIAIMQRQIRQMTRLIDDLLDLARITQGRILLRRDWTATKSIVAVAIEAVQPMINDRQHQLTVTQPEDEIWLNVDSARLAQSLTNLLHNAAKYTSPQGKIGLEVEKKGSNVFFHVHDNGPGLPAEMVNKVFDLFMQAEQTLDRSHGGLGIGLTLVRTLVELHGGSAFAKSEGTGRGSTFTIRLPLPTEPSTATVETTPVPTDSTPLPSLKVLVVDDIQASAKTLVLMLRAIGQHAEAVFDGRSAIAQINQSNFDIVFLDIAMPGMDGLEVARELRKDPKLESLTLVALTGFGQEEDRQRSMLAGFTEHLVKPTSLELLTGVVQRAAASKSN